MCVNIKKKTKQRERKISEEKINGKNLQMGMSVEIAFIIDINQSREILHDPQDARERERVHVVVRFNLK